MTSFMWENSFRFVFPPFFDFIMTDRFTRTNSHFFVTL